jgi:hypothetical protein
MFQNILHDLGGAALYGIVSICLFFLVFSISLIWAMTRRSGLLREIEQLPLVDDSPSLLTSAPSQHERVS